MPLILTFPFILRAISISQQATAQLICNSHQSTRILPPVLSQWSVLPCISPLCLWITRDKSTSVPVIQNKHTPTLQLPLILATGSIPVILLSILLVLQAVSPLFFKMLQFKNPLQGPVFLSWCVERKQSFGQPPSQFL